MSHRQVSTIRQILLLFVHSPFEKQRDGTLSSLGYHLISIGDGSLLLDAIRTHRLVPVARVWLRLLRQFHPNSVEALSELFWIELNNLYRRSVSYNLHMLDAWRNVYATLLNADVCVIPIKGMFLSALAYDDGFLRQVEDLDLIVSVDDLERCADALPRAGFRQVKGPSRIRRHQYSKTLQEWKFEDHHNRLLDIKPVPILHTIARAEDITHVRCRLTNLSVDASGESWPAPDRVAMLIIACMHGTAEGWSQLRHVGDVAALTVRLSPEEWMELDFVSTQWHQHRAVAFGISLAGKLDLIPDISWDQKYQTLSRTVRLFLDRKIEALTADVIEVVELREKCYCARLLRDSIKDRVRCIWRQLMTPSMRDWSRVPDSWPGWSVSMMRPFYLLRRTLRKH